VNVQFWEVKCVVYIELTIKSHRLNWECVRVQMLEVKCVLYSFFLSSSLVARNITLPCFTKCFTWSLKKYGNSGLGLHESIVWKEPFEKILFKRIPICHYWRCLIQVPFLWLSDQWVRKQYHKYDLFLFFGCSECTGKFIEPCKMMKGVLMIQTYKWVSI